MFHFATDKMCSKEKGCPEMTQDGLEGIRLHAWPKRKSSEFKYCPMVGRPFIDFSDVVCSISIHNANIVKQKMFALTAILVKPDNCISLAAHAAL